MKVKCNTCGKELDEDNAIETGENFYCSAKCVKAYGQTAPVPADKPKRKPRAASKFIVVDWKKLNDIGGDGLGAVLHDAKTIKEARAVMEKESDGEYATLCIRDHWTQTTEQKPVRTVKRIR